MAVFYSYDQTILGTSSTVGGSAHNYGFAPPAGSAWSYTGSTFTHLVTENDGALNYNGDPTNEVVSPQEQIGGVWQQTTNIGGTDTVIIYDYSFFVTDGVNTYEVAVLDADLNGDNDLDDAGEDGYYLLFVGAVPPPDTNLTVQSGISNPTSVSHAALGANVVCFTPGTAITTKDGPRLIETLEVGEQVLTADNGFQPIRWIGSKTISGARLHAIPELLPIKICKGAIADNVPCQDMWVSPQHRMLINRPKAALYFEEDKVLAPAKGLVNNRSIYIDNKIKKTVYIHILFDDHQVVFANGAQSESFHPGKVGIKAINTEQRNELFTIFPNLKLNANAYGKTARKTLNVSETRLLQNVA